MATTEAQYRRQARVADIASEATAAAKNEQITRQRVETLERWAGIVGEIITRGFWGRLRWLFLGK